MIWLEGKPTNRAWVESGQKERVWFENLCDRQGLKSGFVRTIRYVWYKTPKFIQAHLNVLQRKHKRNVNITL